jgi:hypothetical protein
MIRNIQENRGGEVWSWMGMLLLIFYQDTGVFAVQEQCRSS